VPAPCVHRVRDSSCTLWWLVLVMENDDTQRDVVLGIFDTLPPAVCARLNFSSTWCLLNPVCYRRALICTYNMTNQHQHHHVLLDSAVMYMGGDLNYHHVGPALLCWARDAPWCQCCLPCLVSWKTIPTQPSELLSTNGRSVNWGPLENAPQRSGNGVSGCPAIVRSPST